MKDYTEIFSNAIKESNGYCLEKIRQIINSTKDFYCGEVEPWVYNSWYVIRENKDLYGYICNKYPVALLNKECPAIIKEILSENHILFTQLLEPLSCDEKVLRCFVNSKKVFNEHFVDDCDYSCDDERFELLLYRLETGNKTYIDSSNFLMSEIQYN